MLGSRAVRACMSKSSTSAFDFAYSSLARRGATNCIRMNPRSRCASGMLGSSSTVYNEQPTSADSCLLRHALKLGTRQIYNNLTKIQHISVSVGLIPARTGNTSLHPHRKGQSTAHPRTYGECEQWEQLGMYFVGSPPRIQGIRNMAIRRITNLRLTPPYGENAPKSLARRAINGSSPRIRGKLDGIN